MAGQSWGQGKIQGKDETFEIYKCITPFSLFTRWGGELATRYFTILGSTQRRGWWLARQEKYGKIYKFTLLPHGHIYMTCPQIVKREMGVMYFLCRKREMGWVSPCVPGSDPVWTCSPTWTACQPHMLGSSPTHGGHAPCCPCPAPCARITPHVAHIWPHILELGPVHLVLLSTPYSLAWGLTPEIWQQGNGNHFPTTKFSDPWEAPWAKWHHSGSCFWPAGWVLSTPDLKEQSWPFMLSVTNMELNNLNNKRIVWWNFGGAVALGHSYCRVSVYLLLLFNRNAICTFWSV